MRYLLTSFISLLLAISCAQRGTPVETPPIKTLLDDSTAEFPQKLSEVGIFDDLVNEIPSNRILPYEIRYPLFSDYNDKSRYLFLPPDKKIDNSDSQQWRFPAGTLFFKTFYLTTLANSSSPRKKIETRILQRRDIGWQTATYQWNANGSEAFLTDGNEVQLPFALPGGNYIYTIPSRLACVGCHQPQENFVIGFEPIRLSGVQTSASQNELAFLFEKNIFTHNLDDVTVKIPGNELERAAIGYLHGNCANCHNPSSPIHSTTELDLRYWRLKENTINVVPKKFAIGDSSQVRIRPGQPEESLLFQLMARTFPDSTQFMPPLGTSMIDTVGVEVVKAWIRSLQ